jgi:hypothetical protein
VAVAFLLDSFVFTRRIAFDVSSSGGRCNRRSSSKSRTRPIETLFQKQIHLLDIDNNFCALLSVVDF